MTLEEEILREIENLKRIIPLYINDDKIKSNVIQSNNKLKDENRVLKSMSSLQLKEIERLKEVINEYNKAVFEEGSIFKKIQKTKYTLFRKEKGIQFAEDGRIIKVYSPSIFDFLIQKIKRK